MTVPPVALLTSCNLCPVVPFTVNSDAETRVRPLWGKHAMVAFLLGLPEDVFEVLVTVELEVEP